MFQDLTPASTALPSGIPSTPALPAAVPSAFSLATIGSAAGWHDGTDIDTLVGLQGTFQWYENLSQFARIRFTFNPGQTGSGGVYTITGLFWNIIEQGQFGCGTQHPLLGRAAIVLIPNNVPANQRLYLFSSLYSDINWKIYTMRLQRSLSGGALGPEFSASRTA